MKRRKKIAPLLGKVFKKDTHVTVIIKGSQTGMILYDGPLLYVPYLLCDDYVLSYVHTPGRLEIVSTSQPFAEKEEKQCP